jgi:hypothetical protein
MPRFRLPTDGLVVCVSALRLYHAGGRLKALAAVSINIFLLITVSILTGVITKTGPASFTVWSTPVSNRLPCPDCRTSPSVFIWQGAFALGPLHRFIGFQPLSVCGSCLDKTQVLISYGKHRLRTLYAYLRFRWVALTVLPRLLARYLDRTISILFTHYANKAFELGYAFIRLQVAGSRFCALTKILHCCTLLSVLAYFLASVGLKAVTRPTCH